MTSSLEEVALQKWVARWLTRRSLLCLAGAAACAAAAVVVLWLTWWAIHGILWFIFLSILPSRMAVTVCTWIVFILLCVAYVLGNREEVEKLEFESPAKLRIARAAAILADSPFLALTGPKTFGSFVRAISAFLLVGPGVAATSWKLFQSAIAGWRGSPEHVADVLKTLATVGVRVPLEELIRSDQTDRFVKTFQAVRLFDGVILRSSEPMGLVLADKLRNEILAIVPPTQGQPAPARPAARSSSAPVPARRSAPSQASPPQAAPKQTPPASPPVAPPKRRPPGRPA